MGDAKHYHGHRQRLRQKFISLIEQSATESMPDYELLEMLLFLASPRKDVKPLAKELLLEFGSFAALISASPAELEKISGLGEGAISALKTVQEASLRLLHSKIEQRPVLSSWKSVLDYCKASMGYNKNEQFRILFLNNQNILISNEKQQDGTVNHTPVYPREVVKRALELGATSLILIHNHPSGDTTPSKADIDMTKRIIQASIMLDIEVLDHLIIGTNEHFSFRDKGLI